VPAAAGDVERRRLEGGDLRRWLEGVSGDSRFGKHPEIRQQEQIMYLPVFQQK
jgi:hypothetical protein